MYRIPLSATDRCRPSIDLDVPRVAALLRACRAAPPPSAGRRRARSASCFQRDTRSVMPISSPSAIADGVQVGRFGSVAGEPSAGQDRRRAGRGSAPRTGRLPRRSLAVSAARSQSTASSSRPAAMCAVARTRSPGPRQMTASDWHHRQVGVWLEPFGDGVGQLGVAELGGRLGEDHHRRRPGAEVGGRSTVLGEQRIRPPFGLQSTSPRSAAV